MGQSDISLLLKTLMFAPQAPPRPKSLSDDMYSNDLLSKSKLFGIIDLTF